MDSRILKGQEPNDGTIRLGDGYILGFDFGGGPFHVSAVTIVRLGQDGRFDVVGADAWKSAEDWAEDWARLRLFALRFGDFRAAFRNIDRSLERAHVEGCATHIDHALRCDCDRQGRHPEASPHPRCKRPNCPEWVSAESCGMCCRLRTEDEAAEAEDREKPTPCPHCHGRGHALYWCVIRRAHVVGADCGHCNGTGHG